MLLDRRVSIIIPVYNRQELGQRALRSAVAQDIEGMEIVIFDDCSEPPFVIPPDLERLADIRLVRAEQNGGESASRNAAVAEVRSNWIAFLDSDDYWLPRTLQPRLEAAELAFAEHKNPLIVQVAGFILDNKKSGQQEVRIPIRSSDIKWFASGCWFCPGSTSLLRKEAFNTVGPCDSALRRLQDMDWYIRLALAGGRIEVWPEIVAVIERGAKANIATLEVALAHMLRKYNSSYSPHCLSSSLIRRIKAYFDMERASVFMTERDWVRAAYCITKSLVRQPRTQLHLERFWDRKRIEPEEFVRITDVEVNYQARS